MTRPLARKLALVAAGFGAAVVVLLIAAYSYDRIGQKEDPAFDRRVANPTYHHHHGPVVAIDEYHRNFHTSSGRYKPLCDLLMSDGYRVVPLHRSFTASSLGPISVLVVANAMGPEDHEGRPAFNEAEEGALLQWVTRGGSLLLIADHAPFGSAAQRLARRFGVQMHLRYARDDENHEGWDNERLVFSRTNRLLGIHPILQGRSESERIDRVVTFTGQSLSGPPRSVALLILGAHAYDWESRKVRYPAAGHSAGIAVTVGEGRLVVLGEAALMSAQVDAIGRRFGMNRNGNDDRQFALNIVHWLSHILACAT